jgi:hypothetical protein
MAKNGFSMSNRVAVETLTAAKTLTADDCGKVLILNTASGLVLTLPSSPAVAGAGWNTTIIIKTSVTGGNIYKIAATNGDNFVGGLVGISAGAAADVFVAGSNDTINLNATDQGGLQGTRITVYSDGSTWHVNGTLSCTGTPASPFATS